MGIFKDGKRRIGYFCVCTGDIDNIIRLIEKNDASTPIFTYKSRGDSINASFSVFRVSINKDPFKFMLLLENIYIVAIFEDWDKNRTCKVYRLTPKEINKAKNACRL